MLKKMMKHFDFTIVVTALLLTGFGIVMVYSASSIIAVMNDGNPNIYFYKQLVWAAIALFFGLAGMVIPYKMYKMLVKPIILGTLLLLVLVLLVGHTANHAQSWFSIGGFSIQPAEIAKLSVIIYLASVFSNKQAHISDFKSSVLPPLIMISLVFLLIAKQPDLGSAMIIAGISGAVILCSGIRVKHILILLLLAAGAIAVIFTSSLSSEQMSRFTSTYDPFAPGVAKDGGWQLIHSYIAIASGGLEGKGLGNSIEKAGFLPEPHTDFIMAVIAEELGVLGVFFVLLCLAYLVIKGILIGIRCQDVFGSLLAIGISSFIAIQTFVNLGAVSGLLPITGVTLPFISYGGSSLVMMMFSTGVLVNISAFVNMREKSKKREAA
ncbi:FtsW/RodA/SpoVE family cell cycle protein [Caenibacillus caldisaponilyticus]|uniref:FtsW/RodA/SpoVE family cell cycle protein n=1 Tax=Caenibacillus caldisaponilyticus TaxID=1674942 RepID=UPI0009884E14|nr:FtsW/RodA/SpoVE family cell cycle protein [Caenibacillus caldisaponilyticus]